MRCPKCGAELSSEEAQGLMSQYMAGLGAKGGKRRGARKARDREVMRAAALKRWGRTKAKEGSLPEKREETLEGSPREKVTIEAEPVESSPEVPATSEAEPAQARRLLW